MTALVHALDDARASLLRRLGPAGRGLLADPSSRVVLYGVVSVVACLGLALAAPLAVFALAPLVLGVPHLVADLRYLVARPALHRRLALAVLVAVPLVASAVTARLEVGLLACAVAAALARASFVRRAVLAAASLGAAYWVKRHAFDASLVFAHAHNFVAPVVLLAAFARRPREVVPVLVFVGLSAAFLLGAFDGALFREAAWRTLPSADTLQEAAAAMAPVQGGALALRLLGLFVFAQGVHYAVWLRLVPEVGRERPGLRSFASSLRALRADLGLVVLAAAAFAGVALVVVAAGVSVATARVAYLHLAAFHGPLELAALVLLLAEGRSALAYRPTC